MPETSYSETFTERVKNPYLELQRFSDVFSLKETQAENEHLWLQHQKIIGAPNLLLRKQELELNQLIQKMYQHDTANQNANFTLEKFKSTFNIKKLSPQQVSISDISIPIALHLFFMLKQNNRRRPLKTGALYFIESPISTSTISLPFEKHCNDVYAISLIR